MAHGQARSADYGGRRRMRRRPLGAFGRWVDLQLGRPRPEGGETDMLDLARRLDISLTYLRQLRRGAHPSPSLKLRRRIAEASTEKVQAPDGQDRAVVHVPVDSWDE